MFFFLCTDTSLRCQCLKKNKQLKRIQRGGSPHRFWDVCTSFNFSSRGQHFNKWHDSLLHPLLVHNALTNFLNQQAMSRCSSLLSVHGPILQCWGRRRSLLACRWGHLLGCRAPPGGCCYLWSLPSPEGAAPSLAWDQGRWKYWPANRLPSRLSGLAPWTPPCVLKVTTKRGNEDGSFTLCPWWDEWITASAPTKVHVEEAVRVNGGFVWRRGVIRVVDVRVFVGCVRRRRLLEMESATLSVIRQMQGSEAGAKCVRAVVKAWDSSSKVKVVHWAN